MPDTAGYARFDSRIRLSLGRYLNVTQGDYAYIERTPDGTLIITPAPFPKEEK